ncbi:MAG: hypothetical protein IJZ35_00135 [Clostridia bacterium]|nr:hypothetical protein [Clostridia bacterium]
MKKLLSVLLTICLLLGVAAPAAYAADDKCDCGLNPIIYVAALGSASVYADYGTENERVLFRPDTNALISEAVSALAPAVGDLAKGDYDAFGDALIDFVYTAFGDLELDGNGDSKENVYAVYNVPEDGKHGIDESFYFNYDFRLDPYEHADRLNECIEQIKELTGHEQVQLRASSMGGVVTMAYLERYGTQDVETIIFQCCPIQGTAVAGDLFNGNLVIDKNALINYALDAIPNLENDFIQGILIVLVNALEELGVWELAISVVDEIIPLFKDKIFDEALIPIFGSMPGIWSFVPDEYYEGAKEFMIVDEDAQAGLVAKIDAYHYNVQNRATEILQEAYKTVKIYNVVGYNVQRTPLVPTYMNTSDGTVDTTYASVGAICADYHSAFSSDYTQAVNDGHNHISGDNAIDASTCALPESTWFIKDMLHSTTHDGHGEMYDWMFTSKEQQTVYSNPDYPQFMQNNVADQTFSEVKITTPVDEFKANPSLTTLAMLMQYLFEQFRIWFSTLLK